MIARRITRTVIDLGTPVERTLKTKIIGSDSTSLLLTTTDFFYIGFHGKFATRYFEMDTANTNSATLTVEYYDGTAWQEVDDAIDETEGFTKSGFISWVNKDDWKTSTQTPIDSDIELFWIRISTDANFSAGTTINSVINIFSDDNLLAVYYPEIANDSRYLPTGQTDFLKQHYAAKDLVVTKLLQRNAISDESEIIDINPVSLAAVHATAWMILNPIAMSDEVRELTDMAWKNIEKNLGKLTLNIDQNRSGTLSNAEKREIRTISFMRR